ncbi:MAG: L-threonylcarbamoyladenylate synthase [Chitinophagaceae bacterium]
MTDFIPDVENCLEVLKQGGTILYPTDTVWGLGCDATNATAVEKLYRLKQRPANKSMVLLLTDERDILKYVTQLDLHVFDYLKTTQKPTTVIYQGVIGIAENIISADGSVAIRLVKEEFCKHLIKRFRRPVVSTSANLSGQPTPSIFSEIPGVIKEGVDYIVQYRQDDTRRTKPSALVKWSQDGRVEVLRP